MKLHNFLGPDFKPSSGSIKIPIGGMIEVYRKRYNALFKRAKFFHQVYTVNPGARLIIHVKVPSEELSKDLTGQRQAPFYYDVLLELEPGPSISDYGQCDVKVFSNCPSFVYSYAYVFAHWHPDGRPINKRDRMIIDTMKGRMPKNNLLIPGLYQQIGHRPTHEKPVIRNPMGIPMFDKSIYFAIFYLQDNVPLQDVLQIHNYVDINEIIAIIPRFENLMNERKRQKNRFKERQARNKRTNAAATSKVEAEVARNASGMRSPTKPSPAKHVSGGGAKVRNVSKVKNTAKPRSTRIK